MSIQLPDENGVFPESDFRNAANPRRRIQKFFHDKTLTKQAFKDDCDINKIVAKFIKTGQLSHVVAAAGQYMSTELGDMDYHEALNFVLKANDAFMQLPSHVRSEFQNDAGQFLEFCHDPANEERMIELGLAYPKNQPEIRETQPSAPAAEEAEPAVDNPVPQP